MRSFLQFPTPIFLLAFMVVASFAQSQELNSSPYQLRRNPFGVADVVDPFGSDVQQLAAKVSLPGNAQDRNAEQWVEWRSKKENSLLDGEWLGRWKQGSGTALIKTVEDRIFVLYTDTKGSMKNRTWLLETRWEGNAKLIGRWVQIGQPRDTGAYVGLVVDNERIDGAWGPGSRWDFRRNIKD